MERPRVHAYFEQMTCGRLDVQKEHELIGLWRANWEEAGFEPVLLAEEDARAHPRFGDFEAAIDLMPTVNPAQYERACWRRWLAMARCGGLMVDYDLVNTGWSLSHVDGFPAISELPGMPRIGYEGDWVPCIVYGDPSWYERMVLTFMRQARERTDARHRSDQMEIRALSGCGCVPIRVGSRGSGLFHVSAGVTRALGFDSDKPEAFRKILASARPTVQSGN